MISKIGKQDSAENPHLTDNLDIKIRFSEVDSLGILWHGHYSQFIEAGRESFGDKFGLSYMTIKEYGMATPLTALNMKYKGYVLYGDIITVQTKYIYSPVAKLQFEYTILNNTTNKTVCQAYSEQVFVNIDTFKLIIDKPIFFKEWESKYLALKKKQ